MSDTKSLLQTRMQELRDEIAAIRAALEPMTKEREQWVMKSEHARVEAEKLTERINAHSGQRLFELKRELATVARALGAYTL